MAIHPLTITLLLLTHLTPHTHAKHSHIRHHCPTITRSVQPRKCHPLACPEPECILLSTISNPCACPSSVPTSTITTRCPRTCSGGCGTAYMTSHSCPTATVSITSSPTTTISPPPTTATANTTCVTVTETTGSTCPTLSCETQDCIVLSTITQNCGCNEIFHTTKCKTRCEGGCSTQYQTMYLPCAFTGPFSTGSVATLTTL